MIHGSHAYHGGGCHTALARAPAHGSGYVLRGHIGFGIGQYQQVVLGAAQRKTAFQALRGALVYELGYFGRANKRYGFDTRVIADGIYDFAVAVDNIEYAV